MLKPQHHLAILLHGGFSGIYGKTGIALLRYSPNPIVAAIDQDHAGKSVGEVLDIDRSVPIVASVSEALAWEPDVLAIGLAPSGGKLPEPWYEEVKTAVASGLSIVNGLHQQLAVDKGLQWVLDSHKYPQQWIWDIRQEPSGLRVGGGKARELACKRVLTVGTDMAVGKMSACLELDRAARLQGLRSRFLPTGQTGIMIAGYGIPVDAVRVDYAAGAVEQLVLRHGEDQDLLFIEGQGSFIHPGSTATLPLIRGSQPTHLILVHRAKQSQIKSFPHVTIPPLGSVVQLYETVATAGGTYDAAKVVGIALNTFHLKEENEAREAIELITRETGIYCTDVVRFGGEELLNRILVS